MQHLLIIVGATEEIFEISLLFFVHYDWLRMNHLSFSKQRQESAFLDISNNAKIFDLCTKPFENSSNRMQMFSKRKGREESPAGNSSEFRFVLVGVCCICDSTCLDYFVIALKIDQLQAYKNSLAKISLLPRIQARILHVAFGILQQRHLHTKPTKEDKQTLFWNRKLNGILMRRHCID